MEHVAFRKYLFLDDVRTPYSPKWDVARCYDEFCTYVQMHPVFPDVISFDHDLCFEHYPFAEQGTPGTKIPYDAFKEKTGYHCAQWLVEKGYANKLSIAYIHTMNSVGRKNILHVLQQARIPRIHFVVWRPEGRSFMLPTNYGTGE